MNIVPKDSGVIYAPYIPVMVNHVIDPAFPNAYVEIFSINATWSDIPILEEFKQCQQ